MQTKSISKTLAILFLSNFSTLAPALAVSDSRPLTADTYRKTEMALIRNAEDQVIAQCDANDVLIKGDCDVENRPRFALEKDLTPLHNFLNENEHSVFVESKISDMDANAWSCRARVVHPQQLIRIISFATCKKANSQAKL